jgi:hypothetical protein
MILGYISALVIIEATPLLSLNETHLICSNSTYLHMWLHYNYTATIYSLGCVLFHVLSPFYPKH